jgi:hypothetical protein
MQQLEIYLAAQNDARRVIIVNFQGDQILCKHGSVVCAVYSGLVPIPIRSLIIHPLAEPNSRGTDVF